MDDIAANQLPEFKEKAKTVGTITTGSGAPISRITGCLTAGFRGPLLLQDVQLIDELAHFSRERIPERVVHAKGAGAFGYFEVTHDITKYCGAKIFEEINKRTQVAVRFSTSGGESGSADTVRDPRGFAVKFYTEDGIWDLVGNNTPIFFLRDPTLFPSFAHTHKRNPQTHLKDPNMVWDFYSLRPETYNQVAFLYSDRGIPDGYRHMNGYGGHTFKLVNYKSEAIYCKFHLKTDQGIKNLTIKKAAELRGSDPDYSIRDLYNAIAAGNYPTWKMCIQVMTFEQAETYKYDPFDLTKSWNVDNYPLIPVGTLVLNRNPSNYFAEVEQLAFAPANLVPGIEPSPDRMLIARIFSYSDTQRYRLGSNYLQLPVNCPFQVRNFQRDGAMCFTDNQGGAPNYYPNSFSGPEACERTKLLNHKYTLTGDVDRYDCGDQDNYSQVTHFYTKQLEAAERKRLAENIAESLIEACPFIQTRALDHFKQVHPDLESQIATELQLLSLSPKYCDNQ